MENKLDEESWVKNRWRGPARLFSLYFGGDLGVRGFLWVSPTQEKAADAR